LGEKNILRNLGRNSAVSWWKTRKDRRQNGAKCFVVVLDVVGEEGDKDFDSRIGMPICCLNLSEVFADVDGIGQCGKDNTSLQT
jgi:hypothetical protein